MKKLLTTIVLIGCFPFVNAQEIRSKKGENYLPEAGDWAISFNADGMFKYLGNAFNGKLDNQAPSLSFTENNAFVGKYFITDKTAYRVIANVGYISTTATEGLDFENNEILTVTRSGFTTILGLGKEWRRGKTRLQGFYGLDVLISANSSKLIVNAKEPDTGLVTNTIEQKINLIFGAGAQGFIGAEYFIFPKFSLGAQYTYRVGFNIGGGGTIKINNENNIETLVTIENNKNYNIGSLSITSINLTLHF